MSNHLQDLTRIFWMRFWTDLFTLIPECNPAVSVAKPVEKHQQQCCQDSFKKFRACKQMVPISCSMLYFGTYPGTNPKHNSDTPCLNWHHVWAKADHYNLVNPKEHLRAFLFVCVYMFAPDAGSFWSTSIEKSMEQKQVFTCHTLSILAAAFVSETSRRRQGGRQVGDK